MSIKFSVLIPTYNRAHYLEECVSSVRAVKYDNLEVIISNNASEDDTESIIISHMGDGRIRYYKQDYNVGAELNILKLLESATGDYLVFLTDDDLLNVNCIFEINRIINTYPSIGVILHALNRVDARSNKAYDDYNPFPRSCLLEAGEESLISLLWVSQVLSSIVLRSDLVDISGYKRHIGSLYPQVYLVGSAMKKAPTYYTPLRLVTHRVFNNTYWRYKEDYMMLDKIDILKDLLPNRSEKHCFRILIDQVARATVSSALMQSRGVSVKAFLRQAWYFLGIRELRRSKSFYLGLIVALFGRNFTLKLKSWLAAK